MRGLPQVEDPRSGGSDLIDRERDSYAWARQEVELLRRFSNRLDSIDALGIAGFLDEWADEMLATVRSQLVNLMAHAAKAALSSNPDVIGHWRSECVEFHDRLIDAYRPSMRDRIDMALLWKRACRKVAASFADHGEPVPALPAECPFTLAELIDPDLDLETLLANMAMTR